MRILKTTLPALLLVALACGAGDEPRSEAVSPSEETIAQTNELRPEPQSVDIQEEPASPAGDDQAALEARERELGALQAELAARERRLRDLEREQARVEAQLETRRAEVERPRPAAPREEPAPAPEPAVEEPAEPAAPVIDDVEVQEEEPEPEPQSALPSVMTVPSGTVLNVELLDGLASNANSAGDTFRMRVSGDVVEDGAVVIPGGSEVLGVVAEAVPLRKVGGRAKLALRFTDLVLPSGSAVPIDASFVAEGKNETGRDAATIGGGAAGGAILGRVLSKKDRSKGSVIGAIIGAAVGTAIASRTAGEEVVIPAGTVVSLKLDAPVEVRAPR